MVLKATVMKQSSKPSLPRVISSQIIKYQLSDMQYDQINGHKHDIHLYVKLSPKLVGEAANKNTKFVFQKTGRLIFS